MVLRMLLRCISLQVTVKSQLSHMTSISVYLSPEIPDIILTIIICIYIHIYIYINIPLRCLCIVLTDSPEVIRLFSVNVKAKNSE